MPHNQIIKPYEAKWLQACDQLAPIFSTCTKRQYFAVILGPNKRLISQGYNGSPPNQPHCTDGACPRAQENSPSGSIYDNCIATHAEANAIMWADPIARQQATLIINGSPCYSCAKLTANSGITRIIGYTDPTYQQEQQVVKYLKDNRIETILLNNKETPKNMAYLNNKAYPDAYPNPTLDVSPDISPMPRHFRTPKLRKPPQ